MIGEGESDENSIELMKRIGKDKSSGKMKGNEEKRDGINKGIMKRSKGIGWKRKRSEENEEEFKSRERIELRWMEWKMIMEKKKVMDLIMMKKIVINRKKREEGIEENDLKKMIDKRMDKNLWEGNLEWMEWVMRLKGVWLRIMFKWINSYIKVVWI